MNALVSIIVAILCFALTYCVGMKIVSIYLYIRNNRVCCFRMEISDMVGKACEWRIDKEIRPYYAPIAIFNRVSYHQMLYSFKRLRLESWYSPDEISIMKGGEQ